MNAEMERRLARVSGSLQPPPQVRSAEALAAELGLVLDPWQREVLSSESDQLLLLCSRQVGKSTVTALLALHTALSEPNQLVLILSPGDRQSGLLFKTIADYYRLLSDVVLANVENRRSLELRNGSDVYALPGKESTVRGFAGVDLLVIDEASRVSDDLYASVRPMLAVSRGRLVGLTTPFGKRGWFWREWSEGGPAWHRVRITAAECPRISPEWLAQEQQRLGPWWFSQEYACEFVDAVDHVFAHELVMAALSDEVVPLSARMTKEK
jgi:hypothetical protein